PLKLLVHRTWEDKPPLRSPSLKRLQVTERHLLNLRQRRCRNNRDSLSNIKHRSRPRNHGSHGKTLRRTVRRFNDRSRDLPKQGSIRYLRHLTVSAETQHIRLPRQKILLIQVLKPLVFDFSKRLTH